VRESSEAYQQATDAAWQAIRNRLEVIKKKLGIRDVELENVYFDSDSSLSRIDELPDEPKSSNPGQIEIRVLVDAQYRIVR
jgi:hypothetical protein